MVLRYIEQGGVMMLNIVIYVVHINFFLFNNPHLFNFFFKKYCKDGFIVFAFNDNTIMMKSNPHFPLCPSIFSSWFLCSVFAFILECPLNT